MVLYQDREIAKFGGRAVGVRRRVHIFSDSGGIHNSPGAWGYREIVRASMSRKIHQIDLRGEESAKIATTVIHDQDSPSAKGVASGGGAEGGGERCPFPTHNS